MAAKKRTKKPKKAPKATAVGLEPLEGIVVRPAPIVATSRWARRLDEIFPRDGLFVEPLSERWRQARRGRLTASRHAAIIANRTARGWKALAERIEAELHPDWQWSEVDVPALRWGQDHEAEAIGNVELALGVDVVDPGLLFHPELIYVAATPDGLIDGTCSLQLKCPINSEIHLNTLYTREIGSVYAHQIQWEAWVSGASEIIFASYDPRQPMKAQLAVVPVPVDRELFRTFDANVREFAELFDAGKSLAEGRTRVEGIPDLF